MLSDDLRHVRRPFNHPLHLLYVAVLTSDIPFYNLFAVYPSLVRVPCLVVSQDVQVLSCNFVQFHKRWQQVDHRRLSRIFHDGDVLPCLLHLCPCCRFRHLACFQNLHRVSRSHCCLTAHALAFNWWIAVDVRQQLNQIRIVDH